MWNVACHINASKCSGRLRKGRGANTWTTEGECDSAGEHWIMMSIIICIHLLDINKMIKSKRLRSVGYVTKKYMQNFMTSRERLLGKLYVDERITCIQRILYINKYIYIHTYMHTYVHIYIYIYIYIIWSESADWNLPDKKSAKDGELNI